MVQTFAKKLPFKESTEERVTKLFTHTFFKNHMHFYSYIADNNIYGAISSQPDLIVFSN